MHLQAQKADVVIVGGGIGGASLATVLAREGLAVAVLERDEQYRDRNMGESMMAWGWADATHLGLREALMRAGALVSPCWISTLPDGSQQNVPVHAMPVDAPGTVSFTHVDARSSLMSAAAEAGADVRFGVRDVEVAGGPAPIVSWSEGDVAHRLAARLVVGADGRGSRVRRQLGLTLERTPRTHVVASLLVGGTTKLGEEVVVVRSGERLLLAVPLEGDRARVYLVSRQDRYTGTRHAERMLEDCRGLPAIAGADPLAGATPLGPCATYGGEDTWVRSPVAEGGLLIGDAAGYNSPIIGQGLSLAMRDARVVSELLLTSDRWDEEALAPFAAERRERLRRVRFTAQLWADMWLRPDEEVMRLTENPEIGTLLVGLFTGFDQASPGQFSPDVASSLLAPVGAHLPAALAG